MKASMNPSPKEKSPSQQIDAIIKESGDWRGKKLSQLRAQIREADPVDAAALKSLVLDAMRLNTSKLAKSRAKMAISSG